MFAAPPVIETEVFARLPDSFREGDRRSDWLDVQRRGAPLDSFLEGPSFDRDGNLYYAVPGPGFPPPDDSTELRRFTADAALVSTSCRVITQVCPR